ncbi:uncharacterized protein LOC113357843 isoform X1 [Papaver somniferum]|uniref:uncharacterized protein LOC113357843 isoform X1 n=1 Tax=Papaver somniferum TaxID=3469 RepID=UPI000E6F935E|nr:uncharacterized protein LOC113357843 isoform X1 [Papaver somniferum]
MFHHEILPLCFSRLNSVTGSVAAEWRQSLEANIIGILICNEVGGREELHVVGPRNVLWKFVLLIMHELSIENLRGKKLSFRALLHTGCEMFQLVQTSTGNPGPSEVLGCRTLSYYCCEQKGKVSIEIPVADNNNTIAQLLRTKWGRLRKK